jgi:hypothetical protein
MITLSRRQAHALRAVFRRAALGISHRGALPPLVLEAQGTQLDVKYQYEAMGIVFALPGRFEPEETILLPLDALGDFEGKADSPVVLEAAAPDRTAVRWEDRHVPQAREYHVPAENASSAFPAPPDAWASAPAELLDALADASETCSDSDTRYALTCLQFRGGAGAIVATDGRQLLVQSGFALPWEGDVLVKRTPLFASPSLPRDKPASIGKTETHVVLRAGPWSLFLEIQKDVRYPDISHVIPGDGSVTSRLNLDAEDAAFLIEALEALPGTGERFHPVTVELNGRIGLRAQGGDPPRITELALSRSRYTGNPIRLNSDRRFVARALRLGFRDVEFTDVESPVAARDHRPLYLWQPLNHESAIEPTDDVIRIESCPANTAASAAVAEPTRGCTEMRTRSHPVTSSALTPTASAAAERSTPMPSEIKTDGASSGPQTTDNGGPTGLTALIREAEALHEVLADARSRTARLITALRRQKRRDRLVASTLTALKELKLQEVNG